MKKYLILASLLIPAIAQAQSYDKAWNPRSTTAYCTDPVGATYYLGPNGSGDDDTYPVTRNTSTFGGTANIADNRRDRDATGGCNLAGSTFQENNTTAAEFRVDLPSTGEYDIHIAMGRANGTEAQQYFAIFDNTTSLTTCFDAATASGAFVDATCVERSSKANWASNEVAYRGTFATTTFYLKYGCNNVAGNCGGSTAGNSNIAHVRIVSVDPTPTPTPTPTATPSVTARKGQKCSDRKGQCLQ